MVASGQGLQVRPLTEFIYEQRSNADALRQGDFLKRTEELQQIVNKEGVPYTGADNRGFLVITQSCDLEMRNAKCKAKYICLAPVRRPSEAVAAQLSHSQSDIERKHHFATERDWNQLMQFVDRLLNNNEPGLFYLPEDQLVGVGEHLCAFLPLTFAVPVASCYAACVAARIVGIQNVFQAKLGWLAGTMYARVGTPALRNFLPKQQYREIRSDLLAQNVVQLRPPDHKCLFESIEEQPLPDETIEAVEKRITSLGLRATRKDRALRRVGEILSENLPDDRIPESRQKRLLELLRSDRELTDILG